MRWKRLVGVLAAVACLHAVAACGDSPEAAEATPEPGWLTAAQAEAEYRAEAAELSLAPGWAWPSTVVEKEEGAGTDLYRVNAGRSDATLYWYCSWGRTYLAETDPQKREAALRQIGKVRGTDYFRLFLEGPDRADNEKALNDLENGEPGTFRRLVTANCPAAGAS